MRWPGLAWRVGRGQPPCLRRRNAAGRGRPVGLALRHLGQHAGADPPAAVGGRGLRRVQPRLDADALPRAGRWPSSTTPTTCRCSWRWSWACRWPALVLALLLCRRCGAAWRAGAARPTTPARVDAAQRLDDAAADRRAQPAGVPAVVRLLPAADGLGCSAMRWARAAAPRAAAAAARPTRACCSSAACCWSSAARCRCADYPRVVVIFAPPSDGSAAAAAHRQRPAQRGCSPTMPTTRPPPPTTTLPPPSRRPSSARRTTCWTRG